MPTLQTNGVFEMHVKNAGGKELVWTIDLKKVRLESASPSSYIHLLLAATTALLSRLRLPVGA